MGRVVRVRGHRVVQFAALTRTRSPRMTDHSLRLPAEWEPQSAVLIAWPHAGTDWAARLASVEGTYAALVAAIVRFEPCLLLVPDERVLSHARHVLGAAGVDLGRVRFEVLE